MKLKEIAIYIIIIITFAIMISHHMNVVSSESMEPVLYKGDIVIINYQPSSVETGNIIVYEAKWFDNKPVIHRLIC